MPQSPPKGFNKIVGQRYMREYGFFGSIEKILLPIAKNFASSVGAEGVEVLRDVSEGKLSHML